MELHGTGLALVPRLVASGIQRSRAPTLHSSLPRAGAHICSTNLIFHIQPFHAQLIPTSLKLSCVFLSHPALLHTSLPRAGTLISCASPIFHIQLFHAQLFHTILSRTTPSHSFTYDILTCNFVTHAHTTLSHTTFETNPSSTIFFVFTSFSVLVQPLLLIN